MAADTGTRVEIRLPASVEAQGKVAASEKAGHDQAIVFLLQIEHFTSEMNTLVSAAFPGEKFAVESQPLLEDRQAEAAPDHVPFAGEEQALLGGIQDDNCVAKFRHGKERGFRRGNNLAEDGGRGSQKADGRQVQPWPLSGRLDAQPAAWGDRHTENGDRRAVQGRTERERRAWRGVPKKGSPVFEEIAQGCGRVGIPVRIVPNPLQALEEAFAAGLAGRRWYGSGGRK